MNTIYKISGLTLISLIIFSLFSCSKDEKDNRLALYGLRAYYKGAMLYRIGEGEVSDSIPVSCTLKPGNGYMELMLDTVPLKNLVREAVEWISPGQPVTLDPAWYTLYGYVIAVKDTGWLYDENIQIQLCPDTLEWGVGPDTIRIAVETPGDALYLPLYKRLDFSLIAVEVKKNEEKLSLPPVQCWFELTRNRSFPK